MAANIREYSQCFPGSKNQVANMLSCDWDQTNDDLTHILFTHIPSQVLNSFEIVPLLNEISSHVTLMLLRLPMQLRYNKEHKTITLGCGSALQVHRVGDDYFLKRVPRRQQPHSLSSFAMAMRKGQFSQPSDAPLACKTVSGAVNHMAASFRSHGTQTRPTTNTVPWTRI